MYKVIKTKLKTTKKQEDFIDGLIYLRKDMWNCLVENMNVRFKLKDFPKSSEIDRFLRGKFPTALASVLQSTRKDYEQAWRDVFSIKKRNEPRFHSWRKVNSLSINSNFNIVKKNKYHLAKDHKIRISEKVPELKRVDLANVTFSRRARKYYISITWKVPDEPATVSADGQIGLDWGLDNFFTDNNGKVYNLPDRLFRQNQRIRALQRVVSKKDREGQSKNWQKAQKKLSDAWCRLNNMKTDYIEKLTYNLLKQNELIAIEDLNMKGLIKRSNKNRRNKMIINSYGRVRSRLLSKKTRFTSEVFLVDTFFPSSQVDPFSGSRHHEMKDCTVKIMQCDNGTKLHRDQAAAMNILNEARKQIASMY